MTAVGAGTAVLGRGAPRRGLAGRRAVLDRSLPSAVLFGATAVFLAVGALPVADGELVLAGLTAAFGGTLLARLAGRPAITGDVAVVRPPGAPRGRAPPSAGAGP